MDLSDGKRTMNGVVLLHYIIPLLFKILELIVTVTLTSMLTKTNRF